ncbi:Matrixin-domain-containing protein [Fusarium oxysporum f. sp. albedinis]|nr:Matrixin-domain-containing protein [Fusarium oxysporum f. sp. albedinis]KAJ0135766.1 Uncharacterized protein HZ326_21223 [Fusarium oxysporum f. sp. albedinis]KAK2469012.1 hypothetical protein H9L39_19406 [Fusarium oxysporum f. sp. albedinis]
MPLAKWHPPHSGDLNEEGRLQDKAKVVNYLQRLGFINRDVDVRSTSITSPLEAFQRSGALPETGVFDAATAELMGRPCCGYIDHTGGPEEFTLEATKWDHHNITYRIDAFSTDIGQQEVRASLTDAFVKWANVTTLKFTEVAAGQAADIRIRFVSGDHGDGYPFDGVGNLAGNVLAHAFNPGNGDSNIAGDAHFDEDETWTVDFLSKVALHEFGHAIGLGHSTDSKAVMYRYFNNESDLQPDDILGVQTLYGPPKPQASWRFCQKCHSMFCDGYPDKGFGAGGGGHSAAGYNFFLPHDVTPTAQTQDKWRFCRSCNSMFFNGFPDRGACARGGGHVAAGMNFVLPHDIIPNSDEQDQWRFCRSCNSMFFNGFPDKGTCARGGGHVAAGYNFVLRHDLPPDSGF